MQGDRAGGEAGGLTGRRDRVPLTQICSCPPNLLRLFSLKGRVHLHTWGVVVVVVSAITIYDLPTTDIPDYLLIIMMTMMMVGE